MPPLSGGLLGCFRSLPSLKASWVGCLRRPPGSPAGPVIKITGQGFRITVAWGQVWQRKAAGNFDRVPEGSLAGFAGAFLRSGRPQGAREALENVVGFAPHHVECLPGPPGPARLQKSTPKFQARLPSGTQDRERKILRGVRSGVEPVISLSLNTVE